MWCKKPNPKDYLHRYGCVAPHYTQRQRASSHRFPLRWKIHFTSAEHWEQNIRCLLLVLRLPCVCVCVARWNFVFVVASYMETKKSFEKKRVKEMKLLSCSDWSPKSKHNDEVEVVWRITCHSINWKKVRLSKTSTTTATATHSKPIRTIKSLGKLVVDGC